MNQCLETAHGRNLETVSLLNLGPAAATAIMVDHDVGGVIAPITAEDTYSSDIQAEFAAIKDALQKVKRPSNLGQNSKQGIQNKGSTSLADIVKLRVMLRYR